jgi:stage IV sporulation protein B
MWKNKRKNLINIILPCLIFFMCLTPSVISYFLIPTHQRVIVGEQLEFDLAIPEKILSNISIHLSGNNNPEIKINGQPFHGSSFQLLTQNPVVTQPGKLELEFKLFDKISLKRVSLDVLPERFVYPGGQSIGVLLQSKGVLVVGYSPIYVDNNQVYPARNAGIKEGDFILSINGHPVSTDLEIGRIIEQSGGLNKELTIVVKQGDKEKNLKVKPEYCQDTGRHRIGLFVRDTTAGVGTLSFYDNQEKVYGALGHMINDGETNKVLDVSRGKIVSALIKGIEASRRGQPGEKIGIFQEESAILGSIDKNTEFGIFGKLAKPISHSIYQEPVPVALANQIKQGKAQIMTVVSEDKIEVFDIEIERIYLQKRPDGKGMVIKITDERLLKLTGGIIQGMSGSPIIQNGRLVGAVTHVFVNDPTRGYGILAEWMLIETSLNPAWQPVRQQPVRQQPVRQQPVRQHNYDKNQQLLVFVT